MSLFKLLGLLLVCYVVQTLMTGKVFAKSGVWGKTFIRDEAPFSYWSAVVVYALLSVFLLVWF